MGERERTKARGIASYMSNPPSWDLVGPNVEDDIRRAIIRYGAAAVLKAAKDMAKPKRGRRKINDWAELREVIDADAREWLNGGDPLSSRTNYAIANEFARRNPGQSISATLQRIERKLAEKPYGRAWYMLTTAERKSQENHSYKLHLRALEELASLDDHPVWQSLLTTAHSNIAEYEVRLGEAPPAELSIKEVENAVRDAILAASRATYLPKRTGGLLGGLLSTPPGNGVSE